MPKLTDYLLTAEAAEYLGVSQNTLRTWSDEGKIPTRRNPANGYRLFQRKDLEAFLRQVERSAENSVKSSPAGRRKPR